MGVEMEPIGRVATEAEHIPRHWTMSDIEGTLVMDPRYIRGLSDVCLGQKIQVIFLFHQSPEFKPENLRLNCPSLPRELGVFSTFSPIRPNALGLSVLEVLDVRGSVIHVKGLDMFDGTPILDIKPCAVPTAKGTNS